MLTNEEKKTFEKYKNLNTKMIHLYLELEYQSLVLDFQIGNVPSESVVYSTEGPQEYDFILPTQEIFIGDIIVYRFCTVNAWLGSCLVTLLAAGQTTKRAE